MEMIYKCIDIDLITEAIREAYCGPGSKGTWQKMSYDTKVMWIQQAKAAIKEFKRQL